MSFKLKTSSNAKPKNFISVINKNNKFLKTDNLSTYASHKFCNKSPNLKDLKADTTKFNDFYLSKISLKENNLLLKKDNFLRTFNSKRDISFNNKKINDTNFLKRIPKELNDYLNSNLIFKKNISNLDNIFNDIEAVISELCCYKIALGIKLKSTVDNIQDVIISFFKHLQKSIKKTEKLVEETKVIYNKDYMALKNICENLESQLSKQKKITNNYYTDILNYNKNYNLLEIENKNLHKLVSISVGNNNIIKDDNEYKLDNLTNKILNNGNKLNTLILKMNTDNNEKNVLNNNFSKIIKQMKGSYKRDFGVQVYEADLYQKHKEIIQKKDKIYIKQFKDNLNNIDDYGNEVREIIKIDKEYIWDVPKNIKYLLKYNNANVTNIKVRDFIEINNEVHNILTLFQHTFIKDKDKLKANKLHNYWLEYFLEKYKLVNIFYYRITEFIVGLKNYISFSSIQLFCIFCKIIKPTKIQKNVDTFDFEVDNYDLNYLNYILNTLDYSNNCDYVNGSFINILNYGLFIDNINSLLYFLTNDKLNQTVYNIEKICLINNKKYDALLYDNNKYIDIDLLVIKLMEEFKYNRINNTKYIINSYYKLKNNNNIFFYNECKIMLKQILLKANNNNDCISKLIVILNKYDESNIVTQIHRHGLNVVDNNSSYINNLNDDDIPYSNKISIAKQLNNSFFNNSNLQQNSDRNIDNNETINAKPRLSKRGTTRYFDNNDQKLNENKLMLDNSYIIAQHYSIIKELEICLTTFKNTFYDKSVIPEELDNLFKIINNCINFLKFPLNMK